MAEKKETKTVAKKNPTAWNFDVLRKPVISEKTAKLAERNGFAFEIDPRATKKDVADAFKAAYNVAPEKVNIVVIKGKTKTFRGRIKGTQKTVKKAYVTLKAGDKVELMGS